jgi:hypothetical protein
MAYLHGSQTAAILAYNIEQQESHDSILPEKSSYTPQSME